MNKEIEIRPQFHPTHSGERFLSYAIYVSGVFAGYSRCLCAAEKAARYLAIKRRDSME